MNSRAQEYIEDLITRDSLLRIPSYEPQGDSIIIQEVNNANFSSFLYVKPLTEETWVPLDTLWYYVSATRRQKTYFLNKTYRNPERRYRSILPYMGLFTQLEEKPCKVETTNSTCYFHYGCIMNAEFQPLFRVMVKVKPIVTLERGETKYDVEVVESKVLVDYSVYTVSEEVEKAIKNWLLPMFINQRYHIELCSLKDMNIWTSPIVPRRLEKSAELCYNVLGENLNALCNALS